MNPRFRPDFALAKIVDKGVENVTTAGKILLDFAAGETALVADGIKEGLRLPAAVRAVTDVVRHRVCSAAASSKHFCKSMNPSTGA